jgi:hypothetical protein
MLVTPDDGRSQPPVTAANLGGAGRGGRGRSAPAVTLRVGSPESQAVAQAIRIGTHDAVHGVEHAVEEQPFDPLLECAKNQPG